MTEFCIITTTTDDKELAKKLAAYVIHYKLAACVQISRVKSIFRWQGKIEYGAEYHLTIKSLSSNYLEVEKAIKAHHNYDVPEIIKIDITGGSSEYLGWLRKE